MHYHFLSIIHSYLCRKLSAENAVKQARELLREHPDLFLGFTECLTSTEHVLSKARRILQNVDRLLGTHQSPALQCGTITNRRKKDQTRVRNLSNAQPRAAHLSQILNQDSNSSVPAHHERYVSSSHCPPLMTPQSIRIVSLSQTQRQAPPIPPKRKGTRREGIRAMLGYI